MDNSYETVTEAVEKLRNQGYSLDFNLRPNFLVCDQNNYTLSPDEFEIDAVYRFEGESNPDDEAVVYAISSPKYGIKGVLVNAYGPYADDATDALIQKLRQHVPHSL